MTEKRSEKRGKKSPTSSKAVSQRKKKRRSELTRHGRGHSIFGGGGRSSTEGKEDTKGRGRNRKLIGKGKET